MITIEKTITRTLKNILNSYNDTFRAIRKVYAEGRTLEGSREDDIKFITDSDKIPFLILRELKRTIDEVDNAELSKLFEEYKTKIEHTRNKCLKIIEPKR